MTHATCPCVKTEELEILWEKTVAVLLVVLYALESISEEAESARQLLSVVLVERLQSVAEDSVRRRVVVVVVVFAVVGAESVVLEAPQGS